MITRETLIFRDKQITASAKNLIATANHPIMYHKPISENKEQPART